VGLVLDQLGGIHLEGLCQLAACLRPGLCAVALDAGERGYGDPYFLRQFLMARGEGAARANVTTVVTIYERLESFHRSAPS
jgi:hypothetical protein